MRHHTWYRDASWGLSPPDSNTRSAEGTVMLRMVSSERRLKDRPRDPLMASKSASLQQHLSGARVTGDANMLHPKHHQTLSARSSQLTSPSPSLPFRGARIVTIVKSMSQTLREHYLQFDTTQSTHSSWGTQCYDRDG